MQETVKSFYCPFCKRRVITPNFFKKWDKVACGICTSFGRHRAAYHIYTKYFLNTKKLVKLLHIAPENHLYKEIIKNKNIKYKCCDNNPDGYKNIPDIEKQDGMRMTYDDETFDFVLHNHVLEHVPNDKDFIKECLRILKPDGIIIASFPYYPKDTNLEIVTASETEREKLYGQYDHVRRYGYNWQEKLSDETYDISELKLTDFISPAEIENENIYENTIFVKIVKK